MALNDEFSYHEDFEPESQDLLCSFCGKEARDVEQLICGPTVYICNECITLCNEIIADTKAAKQVQERQNAAFQELWGTDV